MPEDYNWPKTQDEAMNRLWARIRTAAEWNDPEREHVEIDKALVDFVAFVDSVEGERLREYLDTRELWCA